MDETTSIFELPNKLGGAIANPPVHGLSNHPSNGNGKDQLVNTDIMNDIINSLQTAKNTMLGQFPSKDMGLSTTEIQNDNHIIPNYIPPPPPSPNNTDYVREHIESRRKNANDGRHVKFSLPSSSSDSSLNMEYIVSLLCGLLYFIFNMPVFRALFSRMFPSLLLPDGNLGNLGMAIKASIFGGIVFGLYKVI